MAKLAALERQAEEATERSESHSPTTPCPKVVHNVGSSANVKRCCDEHTSCRIRLITLSLVDRNHSFLYGDLCSSSLSPLRLFEWSHQHIMRRMIRISCLPPVHDAKKIQYLVPTRAPVVELHTSVPSSGRKENHAYTQTTT